MKNLKLIANVIATLSVFVGTIACACATEVEGPIVVIEHLPYQIQKGTEHECGGVDTAPGDIGAILQKMKSMGGDVGRWANTGSQIFPAHTQGANCKPVCAKIPRTVSHSTVTRFWTGKWDSAQKAPIDPWAQYADGALDKDGPGPGWHRWDRKITRVDVSPEESLICTLFRNWINTDDRAAQIKVKY